jgi:hypothetical protein
MSDTWDDFTADLEAMETAAPTMTDGEKLDAILAILGNAAAFEYEGLGWAATGTVALLVGAPGVDTHLDAAFWRWPDAGAVVRWER